MAHQYSVFKPTESELAKKLMNTPVKDLIKRYIRKKDPNNRVKFFQAFKIEVNRDDEDEYLANPYLYLMEGKNLNYAATQVYACASRLNLLGYELNMQNVVYDYDKLFLPHASIINKIANDSSAPVEKVTQDIAYFFTIQLLGQTVISQFEENLSAGNVL